MIRIQTFTCTTHIAVRSCDETQPLAYDFTFLTFLTPKAINTVSNMQLMERLDETADLRRRQSASLFPPEITVGGAYTVLR